MRILWLNHRDPKHPLAGGAEVHLREVSRRLVAKGCQITLLSESFKGSARYELLDGIKVLRVGDRFSIHLLAPLIVARLAKSYDVIIDDIAHAVPWWSSKVTSRPVIGIIHHVHQNVASFELRFPLDVAVKLAERTVKFSYDRIITDSTASQQQIESLLGLDSSHVRVVYCGVDHELYKPFDSKYEAPTILWAGNIKKYKNVDHVVFAFQLAKRRVPKLRLIIYGTGYYKPKIEHLVQDLQLEDVSFIERLPTLEKARLFAKCWVLCFPSFIEGWGLVVTEAGACGTPAVAYNTGSLSEAIIDGKTGLLVDYGNIVALAEKLELLVSNPSLRTSLSMGAIEYSKEFTWERTANTTYLLLEEAISQKLLSNWS
jgi:glycosyltransferase involved in cell wall biosynthesis